jgi:hypothetical protein
MRIDPRRDELDELITSLLDAGGLSDSQRERLSALVSENPGLLDQYIETTALSNALHDIATRSVASSGGAASDVLAHFLKRKPRTVATQDWLSRLMTHRSARSWSVPLAALAAGLLVFVLSPLFVQKDRAGLDDPFQTGSDFVATIASSDNWDKAARFPIGSRVPIGAFAVTRGAVELQFDSGASLLVEAPTQFTIVSASEAQLTSGKVCFRDDNAREPFSVPFNLTTPRSRFLDQGTEYAVSVTRDADEIHVFSGVVERSEGVGRQDNGVDLLKDGQAMRYSEDSRLSAEEFPADPTLFVRELTVQEDDPKLSLLASESFDYKQDSAIMDMQGKGGAGWMSVWWPNGEKLPGHNADDLALRTEASLKYSGSATSSQGGSLGYVGEWLVHRPLNERISLATNNVRYVSFLFRPSGLWSEPENTFKVVFQNPGEGIFAHRIAVGIDAARGSIRGELCGALGQSPLPMRDGATYLIVMKIVATAENSDQLFIRVFQPHEPVPRRETTSWTVTTPTVDSDDSYYLTSLYFNCKQEQRVDELRIGSTWASVTHPWHVEQLAGVKVGTQSKSVK